MKEIFLYRKTIHHTVSLFLTRNYISHYYFSLPYYPLHPSTFTIYNLRQLVHRYE